MSHPEQIEFISTVRSVFPEHFTHRRVLEVGSLDINGSVRSMFTDCDYVGIDVGPGPGVDVVCQGQDYDAPDSSYDTVISCEVMEHNPYWAATLRNMVRLCRPGGLVIMTCATLGRREHGTTRSASNTSPHTVALGWDYYRNLVPRDFECEGVTSGLVSVFATNWLSYDLYMVGVKEGKPDRRTSQALEGIRSMYLKRHWLSFRSMRRAAKAYLLNRRT